MQNFSGLNEKQNEAVNHIDGAMLVLAGAGSGKTKVLTLRIANLINQSYAEPSNILALTFTNKAAKEMRDRLSLLGFDTRSMWIGTFHSICTKLLRMHAEEARLTSDFTIYDSQEQITLIKQCIKELGIHDQSLKPAIIKSCISKAKNADISPNEYSKYYFAIDPYAPKIEKIYQRYQERLENSNALDFDDLLLRAYQLFNENKEILDKYREKFKYIHVDEYQDTNKIQYNITKLLTKENIFVVGDGDQSIYTWRGADIRNILSFEKDFPNSKVVLLEENYRSTQNILDLANSVIKNNEHRKDKNLHTSNPRGEKIIHYLAYDEKDEARFVAKVIKEMVEEGRKYSDFAVLYRSNVQNLPFEYAFRLYDIPYDIVGGLGFYERKEIKDLLAYLKFIVNNYDDLSFIRAITEPKRGIGEKTIEQVLLNAKKNGISVLESVRMLVDNASYPRKISDTLNTFANLVYECKEYKLPSQILQAVLDTSLYIDFLQKEDSIQAKTKLENIEGLLQQLKDYERRNPDSDDLLVNFLQDISLISDQDEIEDENNKVILMTVHSSKGLEFPYVFLVGLEEGIFPSLQSTLDESKLEEERRLCYVAITRAKNSLWITRARERNRFSKMERNRPSRFIDEMDPSLIKKVRSDGSEDTGQQTVKQKPKIVRENQNTNTFFSGKTKIYSEPSSKLKQVAVPDLSFAIGDRVKHKFFGEGVIESISGDDIIIDFFGKGRKMLSLSVAPLKYVD